MCASFLKTFVIVAVGSTWQAMIWCRACRTVRWRSSRATSSSCSPKKRAPYRACSSSLPPAMPWVRAPPRDRRSSPRSKRLALALAHACVCVCVCRFRQSGNEEAGEAAQVRCHTRHRRASAEAKDARTPREALAARYLRRSRAIARTARACRTRIRFERILITPIFTQGWSTTCTCCPRRPGATRPASGSVSRSRTTNRRAIERPRRPSWVQAPPVISRRRLEC